MKLMVEKLTLPAACVLIKPFITAVTNLAEDLRAIARDTTCKEMRKELWYFKQGSGKENKHLIRNVENIVPPAYLFCSSFVCATRPRDCVSHDPPLFSSGHLEHKYVAHALLSRESLILTS